MSKDESVNRAEGSVGIDLGGTNTKLGLSPSESAGAALLYAESFPTRSYRARDDILGDVVAALQTLQRKAERESISVTSLGLGVPATVDLAQGRTLVMPNFAEGWFGFGVVDFLAQTTGLKTFLINDARAFVLAEGALGAARGYRDVFGVIMGTGVGGGVLLDGRVHLGSGALAGEIGHHVVEPGGLMCGCGGVGCLETVASAPALVAGVTRAYLHGRSPVLYELTGGDLNAVSAKTIAQAARRGDAACLEALERVAVYLGVATANVTTLFAPECIVFGGGLAGASDLLFPVIKRTWQKHLRVAGEHVPELRVAGLEQPGVLGAALYARQHQPQRRQPCTR